ncbi:MAG TPA: biosynthetic-type acetolactate synthase large subunit [Clostridia bacterium]|nr:biosynthetic-type acetolactate synthase large subunit [Clostridia bacterium]
MGITGAEALIKCLEEEQVELIFGYPGGAVLPIYDVLKESRIKHILVRQEQAAVHAASGYARIIGRPGVCLSTSGPGATNLVTGIATAYMDSIPLVAITGQVATSMVGTDAFQEVDITGITMPVTKHNYLVQKVEDLPRIVKEAFHIAGTGRPGPVLIDIPKDVSGAGLKNFQLPEKVDLRGYKPTYRGHPSQIRNLAEMIALGSKPLIYAGGGIIKSGAWSELMSLAEKINAPVTSTLMGLGAFPENHPLSLGMVGMHGTPAANYAVQECDLLIGLGVRFDDRVTLSVEKFAPKARIVHVDVDPAEIGKNVMVDLPIVGDLKRVLEDLLGLLTDKENPEWIEQVYQWRKEHPLRYEEDYQELKPQRVLEKLGEMTRERDVIITADVGQHQMWAAHYYRFLRPGTYLTSGGLGTMGYGFPAAIGAQLAAPEATVIAVTGDGSFQMHMAELGTAVENNLPVKILLFNNQNLGMVRQLQHFYTDRRYTGVDFTGNPDFVHLAGAYRNAVGLRISEPGQVEEVLEEALGNGKLTLIECIISEKELVYPVVPNDKGLDEMIHFPGIEGEKHE